METDNIEGKYSIKTSIYEGPFDLLLHLVEEKKLFINDLSLSQVTEDYLNYINGLNHPEPQVVSSFIIVAATLILIKSKSLLPNLNLTNEEEGDIRNLEERLKLFEIYSNLSIYIKDNFGQKIIFAPQENKKTYKIFLPDEQINKENILQLAQSILNKIPQKTILPNVEVKKVISIEEMIEKLSHRIQTSLNLNFNDFAGAKLTKEQKVNVIVSFLAVLEMARQGILSLIQENNFEDIIINKNTEIK